MSSKTTSETSVNVYQTAWRHIPGDINIHVRDLLQFRLEVPARNHTTQVQHIQIVSIKTDMHKAKQLLPYNLTHLSNVQTVPHKRHKCCKQLTRRSVQSKGHRPESVSSVVLKTDVII